MMIAAAILLTATAQAPAAKIDYTRDVRPILETHCYECHGTKKTRGRLRLDVKAAALKGGTTGPAVIPGNADDSLMIRRLLGLDGEDRMPKDKDPLPADQVALLRAWIAQGAPWPDDPAGTSTAVTLASEDAPEHWAYRRPVRPIPPTVSHTSWPKNAIDQFILARLEKEGLAPSHEASKEALIRRLSLDLIGLPPTLAEIDAFVADTRPDAYERLVDRLLASPRYGERWARPWLDLARYADSNGYEKDSLRTMWQYRDWVIKALNDDMPFDEFTVEQLAGDMLPNATRDQIVASGFNRNTLLNQEGGIDVEEARWETLIDRVNTTGTVWLGTTIGCAQCHNHKYDPFSQRDYYRLLAFYDNVEYSVYGQPGGDHWIHEASLDITTADQEVERAKLVAELKDLNARLTNPSPDLDRAQAGWEKDMAATASEWTVLRPTAAHADRATLSLRDDGSVLASGVHAGVDRYVIDLPMSAGAITGVRLEALPDESLPKGGPGRDYYGNFVLTGFRLTVDDGKTER
jgi:mono/diheme cytochrome c family protein